MKVPFISRLNHSAAKVKSNTQKTVSASAKTISHKKSPIQNNLYRRFINFIDNIKTSTLPEETKNIDSMF